MLVLTKDTKSDTHTHKYIKSGWSETNQWPLLSKAMGNGSDFSMILQYKYMMVNWLFRRMDRIRPFNWHTFCIINGQRDNVSMLALRKTKWIDGHWTRNSNKRDGYNAPFSNDCNVVMWNAITFGIGLLRLCLLRHRNRFHFTLLLFYCAVICLDLHVFGSFSFNKRPYYVRATQMDAKWRDLIERDIWIELNLIDTFHELNTIFNFFSVVTSRITKLDDLIHAQNSLLH